MSAIRRCCCCISYLTSLFIFHYVDPAINKQRSNPSAISRKLVTLAANAADSWSSQIRYVIM